MGTAQHRQSLLHHISMGRTQQSHLDKGMVEHIYPYTKRRRYKLLPKMVVTKTFTMQYLGIEVSCGKDRRIESVTCEFSNFTHQPDTQRGGPIQNSQRSKRIAPFPHRLTPYQRRCAKGCRRVAD